MDAEGSLALARRLTRGFEPGHPVRFTDEGDGFAIDDEGVILRLEREAGLVVVATTSGTSVRVHPSVVRLSG